MNLDSLTAALSHIGYLISNLTKKNLTPSVHEVVDIIYLFGGEAEHHTYSEILSHLDWTTSQSAELQINCNNNNNKDKADTPSAASLSLLWIGNCEENLVAFIQQLSVKLPLLQFTYNLAQSIASPTNFPKYNKIGWVSGVLNALKLYPFQEIALLLQLCHSLNTEVYNQAQSFLRSKLSEYITSYTAADPEERKSLNLSPEALHFLLVQLRVLRVQSSSVHFDELEQTFISALQKEFPYSRTPVILLPLLYSDMPIERSLQDTALKMTRNLLEGSLSEMVVELGYGFCNTIEECRNCLINFGTSSITPLDVAHIIGLMIRTYTGLQMEQIGIQNLNAPSSLWSDPKEKTNIGSGAGDCSSLAGGTNTTSNPGTWKIEVFIAALLEVVPNLEVVEILCKLDHKGFLVKDRQGLILLIKGLRCLFASENLRPGQQLSADFLYYRWQNSEEQLCLLTQIILNPDVFCLTDYPCHKASTDCLKAPPEPDKKISTWKSIELLEILLQLSDSGHYSAVKELFYKFPLHHCPDILMLGILLVKPPACKLRHELVMSLTHVFLNNHPNGTAILHSVWQTQNDNVLQIIMHAMAEWYMKAENDQTRLGRILDVAQDLKALHMLLNAQPFPFVIDLACLAYRREFLKLDKWLSDKIHEHGEQFVSACVKFLQRRCPQLLGGKEEVIPKPSQLPEETITIILIALKSVSMSVSQELSDNILRMSQNCVVSRQRPGPIGTLGFAGQNENVNNLSSYMSSLGLCGSSSSLMMFPPSVPSSVNIGNLSLSNAPGSPGRPLSGVVSSTPGTSQSPLPSMMSSLGGSVNLASVVSQLSTLPTASLSNTLPLSGQLPSVQSSISSPARPDKTSFSPDVLQECTEYFYRVMNQPRRPPMSIGEFLELLKKYRESSNKRDVDLYCCLIHTLFEYDNFPNSSSKEVTVIGRLFGGIIDQNIVPLQALGAALQKVYHALQHASSESKIYYFGIVALDNFKTKLKDYERYCQQLMKLDSYADFPAHLREFVRYGAMNQDPPNVTSGLVLSQEMLQGAAAVSVAMSVSSAPPLVTTVAKSLTATTTTVTNSSTGRISSTSSTVRLVPMDDINILRDAASKREPKIAIPPEKIVEKIYFIFNNIALSNVSQKCEELKELIGEDYWDWVSHHMVTERIASLNNFHKVFMSFVEQLKRESFTLMVSQETLFNIKVLLRADKSLITPSSKDLLKNLGHWLGMLTLAKNRPILHVDIDLKSLVIEGYSRGMKELMYVVPFVVKVLESCTKSCVFKPPNPWTVSVLNVLAELHQEQDTKLHHKFEIECLCNTLEINIKDLKPTSILKNREYASKLEFQLSQPVGKKAESTQLFSSLAVRHPRPYIAQGQEALLPQSSSAGTTPTPPAPAMPPTGSASTPVSAAIPATPEPRYVYGSINTSSLKGLEQHLSISLPLNFSNSTQLKQILWQSVEIAVKEVIPAIGELNVKIAMVTVENIIKKDFAFDGDENQMRRATHHMIRNLTAAKIMIEGRTAINTCIKNNITPRLVKFLHQPPEQAEKIAANIARENVGVVCAFIQKTAAEQAILEIDNKFAREYEMRKVARGEGRPFCNPTVYAYHVDRMPEQLRIKVGCFSPQQMAIYEEFAKNIPGFMPIQDHESIFLTKPIANSIFGNEEMNSLIMVAERTLAELEHSHQYGPSPISSPYFVIMNSLLEYLHICHSHRDIQSVKLLLKKTVENLFEGLRPGNTDTEQTQLMFRVRDSHLIVLKKMAESAALGPTFTSNRITKCWIEMHDEVKYNLEIVDCLLHLNLLNIQMLDEYLARVIEETCINFNLKSFNSFGFIIHLVKLYLVENTKSGITENDLRCTLEALLRMCQNRQAPDTLVALIETIRMKQQDLLNADHISTGNLSSTITGMGSSVPNISGQHQNLVHINFKSGMSAAKDCFDPTGLPETTEKLLGDWIQIYHLTPASQGSTTVYSNFVTQMNAHGVLKNDEVVTRFIKIGIVICRDSCVRSILENSQNFRSKCFQTLDAFVRLIALMIKKPENKSPTTRINFMSKVLGLTCGLMIADCKTSGTDFQQLPYHRILIMLFLELNAPEPVFEAINFPVLTAFTLALREVCPSVCPGFAYAWLEIVSHRVFIGRMLEVTQKNGWFLYSLLLLDLFNFLAPFLRNAELAKPLSVLYTGTIRMLLVLLHDFPEFLCEYHYSFCDVIPPNCLHMRNVILSAYPSSINMPSPFTLTVKVESLPEISVSPKITTNIQSTLESHPEFKKNLDSYLKNRTPVTFLSELRTFLQNSSDSTERYNIQMMNALVLYVGMQAIAQIRSKGQTPSTSTIAHSAHMDIFQNLAVDLDTEGRYLFLIAMANHLRYPNSYTHYFSCTMLYLFAEANAEAIQEQISRVLLERMIVKRPHPWGLLITFIELIKNPQFHFWSHDFINCTPEIRIFAKSVEHACDV